MCTHGPWRAEEEVEAVRQEHVGDADALGAGRPEPEVLDVPGRCGAGAEVVVAHRGPAGALVQGERLADRRVRLLALLQHLQLPQVLLGGLAGLALPGPLAVPGGRRTERAPAGAPARPRGPR